MQNDIPAKDISPEAIAELRKIAEAATPGAWVLRPPLWSMSVPTILDESRGVLANTSHHGKMREDALHIVTFNPELVLRMLDKLQVANELIKALDDYGHYLDYETDIAIARFKGDEKEIAQIEDHYRR